MPEKFTRLLAERLNKISQINVKEAEQGDTLFEGKAIIARGGYHMITGPENTISIDKMPSVKGIRPSVDVTMKSVAEVYGSSTIGVVLTGMGSDGTVGASHVKKAGGKIFAQDENTSVIYGMPCSVVESGYADKVIPIQNIVNEIETVCRID
jgi:two-component system chemotaxis response regulator CheB